MPKTISKRPVRAIRQSTEAIKGLEGLVKEAQVGSLQARNAIIERWLPWIEDQARLYAHRAGRLDLVEDLRQSAICGVSLTTLGGIMRAIETFDETKSAQFHTHAIHRINGAFSDVLADNVPGITRGQFQYIERTRAIARDFRAAFGREPTIEDIRRAGSNWLNQWGDAKLQDALTDAKEEKKPMYNTGSRHVSAGLSIASNAGAYSATTSEATQEGTVDARMQFTRMAAILHKSPHRDQHIFIEHCLKGVDQPIIAQELGCSNWLVSKVVRKFLKLMAFEH